MCMCVYGYMKYNNIDESYTGKIFFNVSLSLSCPSNLYF